MKTGKTFADLAVGMTVSIENTVSEQDVIDFARISGDYNPLHMDEDYAKTTQFKGRIAHGALSASYISAILGNDLPGPGAVFMELNLKFVRPVRIGDTVVVQRAGDLRRDRAAEATVDAVAVRVGHRAVLVQQAAVDHALHARMVACLRHHVTGAQHVQP